METVRVPKLVPIVKIDVKQLIRVATVDVLGKRCLVIIVVFITK